MIHSFSAARLISPFARSVNRSGLLVQAGSWKRETVTLIFCGAHDVDSDGGSEYAKQQNRFLMSSKDDGDKEERPKKVTQRREVGKLFDTRSERLSSVCVLLIET